MIMAIWKKVNKNYFQGKSKNAFNSNKWLSIISSRLKKNFIAQRKNDYLDQYISSSPLSFLLINDSKKEIHIADFGSGSQEIFFLLSQINIKKKIFIDSIEVDNLVNFFKKKKFDDNKVKIKFLKNLDFNKKYDYLHISDSLQYVDDWKDFLDKINKKKHNFIILNNIPCGNNKSYLTKQKFYSHEIPNTFFSMKDLQNKLNNYRLISKSMFLSKIKGKFTPLPQPNFSFKDRIGYPKTLVFKIK
jgi:putative methyltransferase (TIGR04325 family)